MKKRTTMIFDLDGTLLDTLEDLWLSTNYALEKNGYPLRTKEEVCAFVGNGVRKLMERATEGTSVDVDFEQVFGDFKKHYGLHCKEHTAPYPGVTALLEKMKEQGWSLAIVSNKMDMAVKKLNKEFFEEWIQVAIGESPKIRKKPAPDTVLEAMKQLGAEADECVYVGDSDVDIQTAKNVGIPCISVTWGFRSEKFLKEHEGKIFAHKPEELLYVEV